MRHHLKALRSRVGEIVAERERLRAALASHEALTVFPSSANFLLVRLARTLRPRRLRDALVEEGVLVRAFGGGLLAGCVRITVGTPEENDLLLATLPAALGAALEPALDAGALGEPSAGSSS